MSDSSSVTGYRNIGASHLAWVIDARARLDNGVRQEVQLEYTVTRGLDHEIGRGEHEVKMSCTSGMRLG